jgi:hypothetical protein
MSQAQSLCRLPQALTFDRHAEKTSTAGGRQNEVCLLLWPFLIQRSPKAGTPKQCFCPKIVLPETSSVYLL